MKTFMAFPICSLVFMSLIATVYFLKPRIKSIENSIYKWLVIVNIIGLVLEILCYFAVDMVDTYYFLSIAILKLYVVYIFIWANIFNSYVFMVSYKNYDKNDETVKKYYQKVKRNSIIFGLLGAILLLFLPIKIFNEGRLAYTYGPITDALIIFCFIMVSFWFIKCIVNIKNLKQKKYISVIACIIVLTLVLLIQSYDRSILISTTGHSFMVLLMFFTIENPDMKIINELNKNRLLVSETNEEKSNFLFLASTQLKKPINNIENLSNKSLDSNTKENMEERLTIINNDAHLLSFLISNIMDISTLTNANIKVISNKYSLINLLEKIRIFKEKEVKSGVDLRFILSKSIPKYLYGDSKLLEQVINSLLDNAIKYTDSGFVELTVNVIVKYDMCRLVLTVYDSGKGMSIDKVNDLIMIDEPLNDEELNRLETKNVDINTIKKIVTKLGGYFAIRSEENKGTEIKIVIDQKIEKDDDDVFNKYLNQDTILVASNDMEFMKNITNSLNKRGFDVENSIYGNDVLDRIRTGENFKYIFLDDMLDKRALEILRELKKDKKFKIPVVVMLDKDTEFIKKHFLEDGFSDYLLKSDFRSEVARILK